jgi:membrane dipeptidase
MGINFLPPFVQTEEPVTMDKILLHFDHVCSLGGSRHVGLGSDFDGIDRWIIGLEHAGKYDQFVNLMLKHFSEEDVEHFVYKNWHIFFEKHFPELLVEE